MTHSTNIGVCRCSASEDEKEDSEIWFGGVELKRLTRATIFGAFILGPLAHYHYNFLEWLVVKKMKISPRIQPFVKMGIEQFTYWYV